MTSDTEKGRVDAYGFDAVRGLEGLSDDVLLVPLLLATGSYLLLRTMKRRTRWLHVEGR